MNSRKVQLVLVVLGAAGLSFATPDRPAQAQSASLAYYAAQLGGGSLAALAGGLGRNAGRRAERGACRRRGWLS
jgi:hypothetical protein